MSRPPLPPFTAETAAQKVRMAEDAWNTRDPARVALAYTIDSRWRNRAEFFQGREAIEAFLTRKWSKELDYRLIKEVWAFRDNRIAVRFAYEWHDDSGNWFRSYGNENWEFDEHGLMRLRIASINDAPDQGERAQVSLAARPPPGRSPVLERSRSVGGRTPTSVAHQAARRGELANGAQRDRESPMPREAPVMKRVLPLSDMRVTSFVQRMLRRPPSPPANSGVR